MITTSTLVIVLIAIVAIGIVMTVFAIAIGGFLLYRYRANFPTALLKNVVDIAADELQEYIAMRREEDTAAKRKEIAASMKRTADRQLEKLK